MLNLIELFTVMLIAFLLFIFAKHYNRKIEKRHKFGSYSCEMIKRRKILFFNVPVRCGKRKSKHAYACEDCLKEIPKAFQV